LRTAEWAEIDLTRALWSIPADKMKMGRAHLVPLSRQAVEILTAQRKRKLLGKFVFPAARTTARPLSENTLNAALRRLGYGKEAMTAHGFRATARTLLDERLRFPPDVIEVQLAHVVRGPLGSTYNRSIYLEQRVAMMAAWSDYLDTLKATVSQ
jgi:integrase